MKVKTAIAERPLGSNSVARSGCPIVSRCVSRDVVVSIAAVMSVTSTRPVMTMSAVIEPRLSPEEADTASLCHNTHYQPVIRLV